LKYVELEGLKRDTTELTHMLHITKRPTIKEVIQMDIDLLLAKIETLKDISSEQFERDLSWAKVVARKPVIPNRYNLLYNDMNGKNRKTVLKG
jgi:hypothetical protein